MATTRYYIGADTPPSPLAPWDDSWIEYPVDSARKVATTVPVDIPTKALAKPDTLPNPSAAWQITIPTTPGVLAGSLRWVNRGAAVSGSSYLRLVARIVGPDGSTRVPLATVTDDVALTGSISSPTTRLVEATIAPTMIGADDRLVLELGALVGAKNGTVLSGGSVAAGDLPWDDGVTHGGVPWVELTLDDPPAIPLALTQTASTPTSVTVSWQPPTPAPDRYEVRVDAGSPVAVTGTARTIGGLAPGPHLVEVRSIGAHGAYSAWVGIDAHPTPTPPPPPSVAGNVVDRVLAALGPAVREQAGPLLPLVVDALTTLLAEVDDLTRPTGGGWPAWADLDETPHPAWLAAATGTRVPVGLTPEEVRAYVRDRAAWRRGTPAAILAAARQAYPTGLITLVERDGSPGRLTIRLYEGEASEADKARVITAVLPHKPVGIVLSVERVTGASWGHTNAEHGPTWADVAAEFPTWGDLAAHIPEEGTDP